MNIILEVAVSSAKNIRLQERIKRVRYTKNSTVHITKDNVDVVARGHNLAEALGRLHRCPVALAALVVGTLGEIELTEEHAKAVDVLSRLGVGKARVRRMLEKIAEGVTKASASLIMRRLNQPR